MKLKWLGPLNPSPPDVRGHHRGLVMSLDASDFETDTLADEFTVAP